MAITIKNKYLIIGILLTILMVFALGQCSGRKKAESASDALIIALKDTITQYEVKINGATLSAYKLGQMVITQKQAIREGIVREEELKKLHIKTLNELTRTKMSLSLVRDSIKHTGVVIHVDTVLVDGSAKNAILLPFNFAEKNKYFDLNGRFDMAGTMSLALEVPINIDLYSAIDRKTRQFTSTITVDNPFVKINDIKSVKLNLPKEKRWGVGAFAGYGINLSGTIKAQPVVGLGISYSVIRF